MASTTGTTARKQKQVKPIPQSKSQFEEGMDWGRTGVIKLLPFFLVPSLYSC